MNYIMDIGLMEKIGKQKNLGCWHSHKPVKFSYLLTHSCDLSPIVK